MHIKCPSSSLFNVWTIEILCSLYVFFCYSYIHPNENLKMEMQEHQRHRLWPMQRRLRQWYHCLVGGWDALQVLHCEPILVVSVTTNIIIATQVGRTTMPEQISHFSSSFPFYLLYSTFATGALFIFGDFKMTIFSFMMLLNVSMKAHRFIPIRIFWKNNEQCGFVHHIGKWRGGNIFDKIMWNALW